MTAREVARPADAEIIEGTVDLLPVLGFAPGSFAFGRADAESGRASLSACSAAIRAAVAGEAHAVIAAPLNQTAIAAAGIPFDGYPSFLARGTGLPPDDVFLMHCFNGPSDNMPIVHATLHVSVRRALELLTRERIARALTAADAALRRLGIAAPRIAVGGLNPHGGEGGLFGEEDDAVTVPAIADARAAGANAEGPFGTATMYAKRGYDAFVVMLHDQGHIASKLLGSHRTAGIMIGAPILFSSVARGSGRDIAGGGKANPAAMIEAVKRLPSA